MKFSVIVPMFNSSATIGRCISSIKQQSYKDFECFLIDDGSTDKTAEICRHLTDGDRRFILLRQTNRGVSAARNAGLERAAGSYLVFLDSDDFAESSLLQKINENADGKILQYGFYSLSNGKRKVNAKCGKRFDIISGNMAVVWRHAVPRKNITDLRFDENLSGGEDYLFLNEALKIINAVKVLPGLLYSHTFDNKSSIMNNTNLALLKQQVEATEKVKALYGKDITREDRRAIRIRESWCKGELLLYALNLYDKNPGKIKNYWRRFIKKAVMLLSR